MNLLTAKKIKFSKKVANRILGKTKRWVIQGAVATPFTPIIPAQAISYIMKQYYPPLAAFKVGLVCTKRGNKAYWIFDEDEFTNLGRWCMTHPSYISKIYKEWRIDNKNYYQFLKRLGTNSILNPYQDFVRFYKLFLRQWCAPLMQEYYSLAGNEFINQLVAKHGYSNGLRKSIDVLSLAPKLSFFQSTELAMTELALKLVDRKIPKKLALFKKKFPKHFVELEKILKDFFWIHFSYFRTKPHSIQYFYHQVYKLVKSKKTNKLKKRYQELKNYEKTVTQRQRTEIKKTRLTREEIRILKTMGFVSYWQDERKRANLLGNFWCNNFFKHIAKQGKYKLNELPYLLPSEFIKILKGKRMFREEIKQRMKGCFYFVFVAGQEGMITGAPYKKLWTFIKQMNHPGQVKELKGTAASTGKYIGRVRKIESPHTQGKRMKSGEVLIAYMTRPDFVPLMHKAGAIVTDEGGLTSHAAIVSRELGVPCIVGTRFAMRVLKDGDKIEVDAEQGVVRKI